jgi:hypothetical protein
MDYTTALLQACWEDGRWVPQEMLELALAHHVKHGRAPLPLNEYRKLIWESMKRYDERWPDHRGHVREGGVTMEEVEAFLARQQEQEEEERAATE